MRSRQEHTELLERCLGRGQLKAEWHFRQSLSRAAGAGTASHAPIKDKDKENLALSSEDPSAASGGSSRGALNRAVHDVEGVIIRLAKAEEAMKGKTTDADTLALAVSRLPAERLEEDETLEALRREAS